MLTVEDPNVELCFIQAHHLGSLWTSTLFTEQKNRNRMKEKIGKCIKKKHIISVFKVQAMYFQIMTVISQTDGWRYGHVLRFLEIVCSSVLCSYAVIYVKINEKATLQALAAQGGPRVSNLRMCTIPGSN